MLKIILLMTSVLSTLPGVQIDAFRLSRERAADRDVIASLKRNGDCPSIVRPIDLRFVGAKENLAPLNQRASEFGFQVVDTVKISNGIFALDLTVQSDTTETSIDNLTMLALRIETRFKLRYDGWGTVAKSC